MPRHMPAHMPAHLPAHMPGTAWSSGMVPYGADETVYLVVDSASIGAETEIEGTDLETIVGDMLCGRYNNPIRVVAFNTLEHWSEDVSSDIAAEIQVRCDIDGVPLPEHLTDFVQSHRRPTRQPALCLA